MKEVKGASVRASVMSWCRVAAERNNWYRLKRAVEILLRTRKPLAESQMALQTPWSELQYDFRPFFLTRPRLEVFARIDARVERMVRKPIVQWVFMMKCACYHMREVTDQNRYMSRGMARCSSLMTRSVFVRL